MIWSSRQKWSNTVFICFLTASYSQADGGEGGVQGRGGGVAESSSVMEDTVEDMKEDTVENM